MPSDLDIGLGILFGMLCAYYHVHVIRLARQRLEDLGGDDREAVRRKLEKPLLVLCLIHVVFGTAGFVEGAGGLYTMAFGRADETTYVVWDVVWKTRARCYKYTFAEMSILRNYFGAPCLDLEYAAGSRFHYRGQSSPLGFKADHFDIESEQRPLRHKPLR